MEVQILLSIGKTINFQKLNIKIIISAQVTMHFGLGHVRVTTNSLNNVVLSCCKKINDWWDSLNFCTLQKKKLMFDEMTKQIASIFFICLEYEKVQYSFFFLQFFVSGFFIFPPNECLGLCEYWHGKRVKLHEMKNNETINYTEHFLYTFSKNTKIFEVILLVHFIKHKQLIFLKSVCLLLAHLTKTQFG